MRGDWIYTGDKASATEDIKMLLESASKQPRLQSSGFLPEYQDVVRM